MGGGGGGSDVSFILFKTIQIISPMYVGPTWAKKKVVFVRNIAISDPYGVHAVLLMSNLYSLGPMVYCSKSHMPYNYYIEVQCGPQLGQIFLYGTVMGHVWAICPYFTHLGKV